MSRYDQMCLVLLHCSLVLHPICHSQTVKYRTYAESLCSERGGGCAVVTTDGVWYTVCTYMTEAEQCVVR